MNLQQLLTLWVLRFYRNLIGTLFLEQKWISAVLVSASFPAFLATSSFLIIESFLLQHGRPDRKWVLLQKVMNQRQGASWHDQEVCTQVRNCFIQAAFPFPYSFFPSGWSVGKRRRGRTFRIKLWMSSYGKEKSEKTWNNLTIILKSTLRTFMLERNTLSWITSL